jgi:hypothetical protein
MQAFPSHASDTPQNTHSCLGYKTKTHARTDTARTIALRGVATLRISPHPVLLVGVARPDRRLSTSVLPCWAWNRATSADTRR